MLSIRIATSRRRVQGLLLVLFLLMPYVSLDGKPALRMDIAERSLFLAGATIRIDQFYLVLLLTLLLVTLFLLLTMVLGRVWCGWFCPQTVLNDLTDMVRERARAFRSTVIAAAAVHVTALLVSILVSFTLLCFFLSPVALLNRLSDYESHPVVVFVFLCMTLLSYVNLIVVKRRFCLSYCPYGRFQTALLDDSTLNLTFIEETRDRCIQCRSCVSVCPMGIDIRQGFQIECIHCGRCIDACRGVMERTGGSDGLIAYRFGEAHGAGFQPGRRFMLLSGVICILAVLLVWGLFVRSDEAFLVQRIATAETKTMPDGSQVQAWRAVIGNHSELQSRYSLKIDAPAAMRAELLGPVKDVQVAPNQNLTVSFSIRFTPLPGEQQKSELLLLKEGHPVATVRFKP